MGGIGSLGCTTCICSASVVITLNELFSRLLCAWLHARWVLSYSDDSHDQCLFLAHYFLLVGRRVHALMDSGEMPLKAFFHHLVLRTPTRLLLSGDGHSVGCFFASWQTVTQRV